MQRYAVRAADRLKERTRRAQRWEHSRPRDNRPQNRPHHESVSASPAPSHDVSRARFAAFVARSLDAARRRGMTDKDIHRATGVPPSTFHRWQKGSFATAPDLDKVRAFCAGLGISPAGALAALGLAPQRDEPAPEPPLPPEVRTILRKLADPNVSEFDKQFMRETLHMLAERVERTRPRED